MTVHNITDARRKAPMKSPKDESRAKNHRRQQRIEETYAGFEYLLDRYAKNDVMELEAFIKAYQPGIQAVRMSDIVDAFIRKYEESNNVFAVKRMTTRIGCRFVELLKPRLAREDDFGWEGEIIFRNVPKKGGTYELNQSWGKAPIRVRKPRTQQPVTTPQAGEFVSKAEFRGLGQKVDKLTEAVGKVADRLLRP